MKVAYWPGCVSRGFTPELHGSMAQVAPLLDIELVELDRAACCGAGKRPFTHGCGRSRSLADTPRPWRAGAAIIGAEARDSLTPCDGGASIRCSRNRRARHSNP